MSILGSADKRFIEQLAKEMSERLQEWWLKEYDEPMDGDVTEEIAITLKKQILAELDDLNGNL